tara:strand:+ start:301 stop:612 length:312 start_codon:yes stop_codon:yes gene_type:complete
MSKGTLSHTQKRTANLFGSQEKKSTTFQNLFPCPLLLIYLTTFQENSLTSEGSLLSNVYIAEQRRLVTEMYLNLPACFKEVINIKNYYHLNDGLAHHSQYRPL